MCSFSRTLSSATISSWTCCLTCSRMSFLSSSLSIRALSFISTARPEYDLVNRAASSAPMIFLLSNKAASAAIPSDSPTVPLRRLADCFVIRLASSALITFFFFNNSTSESIPWSAGSFTDCPSVIIASRLDKVSALLIVAGETDCAICVLLMPARSPAARRRISPPNRVRLLHSFAASFFI